MSAESSLPPLGRESGMSEWTCREVLAHLDEFIDRECDGELAVQMAAHVAVCPRCAGRIDADVALRRLLRSRCVEQAPERLRQRVLGRLSRMTTAVTYEQSVESVSEGGWTVSTYQRSVRYTRD